MCILEANPPTGFTLNFSTSIIMIDPPNPSTITAKNETDLPIYILVTNPQKTLSIPEITYEYYVASPPPKGYKKIPSSVYVYPVEKPIHIHRNIRAYFLDPPPKKAQSYFILLDTPFAEILVVPRTTIIPNPPMVDVILTTEQIIHEAKRKTKNMNEIPKYLGADAQWCIAISNQDIIRHKTIYIHDKKYIIQRHLTQINIIQIQ